MAFLTWSESPSSSALNWSISKASMLLCTFPLLCWFHVLITFLSRLYLTCKLLLSKFSQVSSRVHLKLILSIQQSKTLNGLGTPSILLVVSNFARLSEFSLSSTLVTNYLTQTISNLAKLCQVCCICSVYQTKWIMKLLNPTESISIYMQFKPLILTSYIIKVSYEADQIF